MRVEARRVEIADLARSLGRVTVQELTDKFGVNAETIRRDLVTLEAEGVVQRIHGGAIAQTLVAVERRIASRVSELREQKIAIARAAAKEIPTYGTVFIEAGSTTAHLADQLANRGDLLVVTNALQIALALSDSAACTVMTIGGRIRQQSYAEVDAWALERLSQLRFEVAFVGTNAVDVEWGLSTMDPAEAAVKAAILRSASKSVLLADHSKFGLRATCRYAGVSEVNVIITDQATPTATLDQLDKAGARVRRVEDHQVNPHPGPGYPRPNNQEEE